MLPPQDHPTRRKEQRRVLLIGMVVAALPIVFQLLVAGAVQLDPPAFPKADKTLFDLRFWEIQIVLLCVAVSGNTAVDWIRPMLEPPGHAKPSLMPFLLLVGFFLLVSIMFSVSLLDTQISLLWIVVMATFGIVDLFVAYLLEMEIAAL